MKVQTDRGQLADAIAKRKAAEGALKRAQEVVTRGQRALSAAIDAQDVADAEAKKAGRAAVERYALALADGDADLPPAPPDLVVEAARRVDLAKGALQRLRSAVVEAERHLSEAKGAVNDRIGELLAAAVADEVEALKAMQEELEGRRCRLHRVRSRLEFGSPAYRALDSFLNVLPCDRERWGGADDHTSAVEAMAKIRALETDAEAPLP